MSFWWSFTNQAASKKRPAVVISNGAYNLARPDIVMMPIPSQLHSPAATGEVWTNEWQAASLLKPSAVKAVFVTLEQSLVLKRLGALQPPDPGLGSTRHRVCS